MLEYELIKNKSAWYGPEEENKDDWIYVLDDEDIDELDLETQNFINNGSKIEEISHKNFKLKNIQKKIQEKIDQELKFGRGFSLVRGMPVKSWSKMKIYVAYMGFCSFFGNFRVQNKKGHLLGHIKDLGKDTHNDFNARVYETSYRQTFHSDRSDIVALLCLNKAKKGGESLLVSSMTIYNEILKNYPEYIQILFEPFPVDRRGEEGPGQKPYSMSPIFYKNGKNITSYFLKQYFESAKRFKDLKITKKQEEAVELVDKLSNDKSLYMRMSFEPGDIQLIYNHTLFHDRMAYEDYQEEERKRHLLRLWISAFNDQELSAYYEDRWGSVEVGYRGGVYAEKSSIHVPFDVK